MKRALLFLTVLVVAAWAPLALPGSTAASAKAGALASAPPASPVGDLDRAIDGAIAADATAWVHARSLLWHLVAGLLLLGLLRRLGATPTGATIGALVFLLHPAATEAVAFPDARGELLAAVLVLAALALHRRSRGLDAAFAGAAVLLLLGLLAGFGAAAFPLLAFLVDDPDAETRRRRTRYAAYAAVAVAVVAARLLLAPGGGPASAGAAASRLVRAFVYGLRLALLPVDLTVGYPVPAGGGTLLLAVCLVVLVVVAARRPRAPLAAGVLWFLAALLPPAAIAAATARPFAESLLYLPLVGVGLAAGRLASLPLARRAAVRATLTVALAALAAGTFARARDWRSEAALATATLRRHETAGALEWRARGLAREGRDLLDADGEAAGATRTRGLARLREAAALYGRAAAIRTASGVVEPAAARSRVRCAEVYLDLGYHQRALQESTEALADPDLPNRAAFLLVRAKALHQMGDARGAARAIERALALRDSEETRRTGAAIYRDLARWYAGAKGLREGPELRALRRSRELDPSPERNGEVLRAIEAREAEYARTRERLQAELARRPGNPDSLLGLAVLEGRMGNVDAAADLFHRLTRVEAFRHDPRVMGPYALYCFEGLDTLEGYDRAWRIYEDLLREHPGSEPLRQALNRVRTERMLLEASLAQ